MAQIEAYKYFASLKKKKRKKKEESNSRPDSRLGKPTRLQTPFFFFLVRVGFQTAKPN